MSIGPALYKGRVGSTGTSTGPHAHFELLKNGKRIPLSTARSDIGQYLQFRLPGSEDWQSLYSKQADDFVLNPAAVLTSPMGMRMHPVHNEQRMHGGEDYGLPEGTQLRFLGQGSVATHANRGGAGNVSSLRTGPYELQTFHLSELPEASTTRGKSFEQPEGTPSRSQDTAQGFADDYLEQMMQYQLLSQLSNQQQRNDPMSRLKQMMGSVNLGVLKDPFS